MLRVHFTDLTCIVPGELFTAMATRYTYIPTSTMDVAYSRNVIPETTSVLLPKLAITIGISWLTCQR